MGALTDEQRDVLYSLFQMNDFRTMYDVIHQEYKSKELGSEIADDERIAEYQYITQQLRKFISSKQEQVLAHGSDLRGMLDEVEGIISNAKEYGSSRKEVVYNFIRDSWLLELYNGINWLIDQMEEE